MICPCCGSDAIQSLSVNAFDHVQMGFRQKKIVDVLAKAYPRPMSKDALIDAVYACDPQGGPDYASSTVGVMIFNIRKRLKPYGWSIPVLRGGPVSRYRLQPISQTSK